MKKLTIALLIALGLTACTEGAPPAAAPLSAEARAATTNAVYTEVATHTKGLTVGKLDSQKVVYVLFDPKCPHCADLWTGTKSLHNDIKFVWIPVGLLSRASLPEGAGLLQAGPAAMDTHEAQVKSNAAVAALPASDASLAAVKANTDLALKIKLDGVPYMFYKDPENGQVRVTKGGLTAEQLKSELKL